MNLSPEAVRHPSTVTAEMAPRCVARSTIFFSFFSVTCPLSCLPQAPLKAIAPMQMLVKMLRFIKCLPSGIEMSRKCAIFGIKNR